MNLTNRSFLKLLDYTPEEIEGLLDLAADLKAKKKPIMDFVELMCTLYALSPKASLIALVSNKSLYFVLVPCALI